MNFHPPSVKHYFSTPPLWFPGASWKGSKFCVKEVRSVISELKSTYYCACYAKMDETVFRLLTDLQKVFNFIFLMVAVTDKKA